MSTPQVVPVNSDELSAERMLRHLNIIAAEQRSVLEFERRMYVRDYIIDVMEGYGLTVEIDDFEIDIPTYRHYWRRLREIRGWTAEQIYNAELGLGEETEWQRDLAGTVLRGSNLLFRQQGRNDTAIMLVAHIDSPSIGSSLNPASNVHSLGAADAGYGLTTMLEIARHFAGQDLENSIYFLFTDLHEIGLWGAYFALENMDFSNVSMVLNLEARGVRGPVLMFETQANNYETMRFFRNALSAANAQPMSNSAMTAVYRFVPNNTDLTLFINRGFNGMNFAPIDSLFHYHTPQDSLEYISLTTMQHYINLVGALVERFTSNPQYSNIDAFQSDREGVFFPLPFQGFVLYSDIIAMALGIIMLVAVIIAVFCLRAKAQVNFRNMGRWICLIIGAALAAALLGLLISFIVSLATGIRFGLFMPRVPHEMLIMWCSVVTALIGYCLLHRKFKKKFSRIEMAMGAMFLMALVVVFVGFVSAEATYSTFIPLVFAFACFGLSLMGQIKNNRWLMAICASIPTVIAVMMLIPSLIILTHAITIGGLAAIMYSAILMCMALPTLWRDDEDTVQW